MLLSPLLRQVAPVGRGRFGIWSHLAQKSKGAFAMALRRASFSVKSGRNTSYGPENEGSARNDLYLSEAQ